jgi:hypothetical protein
MSAVLFSPTPFAAPLDTKFVGSLDGRFILPDRKVGEVASAVNPCRSQSITAGEIIVASPVQVTIGERFASMVDRLGPINGKITRIVDDGFVVAISASAVEQKSLAATINWLKKRHTRKAQDHRTAPRTKTRPERCIVSYLETNFVAELFDVSISGASLASASLPPVDALLRVGSVEGQVMRHAEGRFGVKFATPQSLATVLQSLTDGNNIESEQ